MKKTIALLIAISMSITSIPAFAWGNGDDNATSIEKTDARKMNKVLKGTVLQVSVAKIDSSAKAVNGTAAGGGLLGGVVGANSNNGLAGMLIGAVVGTIAGSITGAIAGSQEAQDLIIQLEDNDIVNITQAVDDKVGKFAENDLVMIVYKGDSGRVIRNKLQAKAAVAAAPAPVATANVEAPDVMLVDVTNK